MWSVDGVGSTWIMILKCNNNVEDTVWLVEGLLLYQDRLLTKLLAKRKSKKKKSRTRNTLKIARAREQLISKLYNLKNIEKYNYL